ncbi:MAG: prepilin-type N-terminal cleavage/methylation domain-containing protein [Candidatus Omnitrophota bacterium]|nr:MAG: prepilin-type N-terminal cleavage/methylation domain-containing protein [Candidatus Omnitrophota bacterium]
MKAFTVTELLAVVVIIGILAAISYPRFQAFRIKARLREVPNTVQLILAAEKYYHFKRGFYYTWVYGTDPSDVLNISLPGADSMCQYQVTGTAIQFQRRTPTEDVGSYDMATDSYDIKAAYEKYLGYLE